MAVMNRTAQTEYSPVESSDHVRRYLDLKSLQLPRFDPVGPMPYVPTFMIGFPRSGTTLLETILDTQPGIRTLSEADAITAVRRQIGAMGKSYPEDLHLLTADEVNRLRDIYFDHNRAYIETGERVAVLIDKLPLNIIHVPLIQVLFPEARFILSLRHPADACLSCFQQDFLMNNEMIHFTDLKSCFLRYRDVMGLFERYRSNLKLSVYTVRYEELVTDLAGVAEGLFAFLGVKPDLRYREFHTINKDRLVATPSRSQVSRPLYRSSQNRWMNYRQEISPLLFIIQEFLDRYGYNDGEQSGH